MGNKQSAPTMTLEEEMKQHKRTINRAIRELDRERNRLVMSEKKTVMEMKKLAQQNQVSAVKIMAKDLVRCRKFQTKFLEMKAQLTGVSLQMQTMKSTQAMTDAMKGTTKIMIRMNQSVDMKEINKIMQEFMTENERTKITQEALSEGIDDAMEDDEGEQEEVVAQVLDEIGINMKAQMNEVKTGPMASNAAPAQAVAEGDAAMEAEEDDLEARLNALKR